ncbi:MAG: hypothetical protein GVY09_07155 [Gammaproteobacteria bacterium]|nr:hypothetical protein [Gammaproteobacteria bacterium]
MLLAVHEHRVCTLAHRMGLRLVRATNDGGPPQYRLVEPHSMTPVLPGSAGAGADLAELEEWLQMPWE